MLEDLLRLRDELKDEKKYSIFSDFGGLGYGGFSSKEEEKTINEIKESDDTDKIIVQCEELMKKVLSISVKNNIPIESIKIESLIGYICENSFVRNLANELTTGKEWSNDEWILFLKKYQEMLPSKISNQFVYVDFKVDLHGCDLPKDFYAENEKYLHQNLGDYLDRVKYSDEFYKELNEIENFRINGIVDFNKFIKAFKELGYNACLYDSNMDEYIDCSNFMDYLNYYLKSIEANVESYHCLCVEANLKKSNELNNKGR